MNAPFCNQETNLGSLADLLNIVGSINMVLNVNETFLVKIMNIVHVKLFVSQYLVLLNNVKFQWLKRSLYAWIYVCNYVHKNWCKWEIFYAYSDRSSYQAIFLFWPPILGSN